MLAHITGATDKRGPAYHDVLWALITAPSSSSITDSSPDNLLRTVIMLRTPTVGFRAGTAAALGRRRDHARHRLPGSRALRPYALVIFPVRVSGRTPTFKGKGRDTSAKAWSPCSWARCEGRSGDPRTNGPSPVRGRRAARFPHGRLLPTVCDSLGIDYETERDNPLRVARCRRLRRAVNRPRNCTRERCTMPAGSCDPR